MSWIRRAFPLPITLFYKHMAVRFFAVIFSGNDQRRLGGNKLKGADSPRIDHKHRSVADGHHLPGLVQNQREQLIGRQVFGRF